MSNVKQLTVGDLLEVLRLLPKDLPVMYINVEGGGYDSVTTITGQDVVVRNVLHNYFTAEFDEPRKDETGQFKAIIFS